MFQQPLQPAVWKSSSRGTQFNARHTSGANRHTWVLTDVGDFNGSNGHLSFLLILFLLRD